MVREFVRLTYVLHHAVNTFRTRESIGDNFLGPSSIIFDAPYGLARDVGEVDEFIFVIVIKRHDEPRRYFEQNADGILPGGKRRTLYGASLSEHQELVSSYEININFVRHGNVCSLPDLNWITASHWFMDPQNM